MHRVIGELLVFLAVCSALWGNYVTSAEEFGFEPRDSLWSRQKPRKIEVISFNMTPEGTETPLELELPVPDERGKLCELCTSCYMCVNRLRHPTLPEDMLKDDDKIIFHSIKGRQVKNGLIQYIADNLEYTFWRLGLKPLRVYISYCTVIVSMYTGAFPACNCDPPPDSYQLYVGNLEKMFLNSTKYTGCVVDALNCSISVTPPPTTVYYVSTNETYELLQPTNSSVTYMQVPSFKLTIFFEAVRHPAKQDGRETYMALSRRELKTLISDMAAHHKKVRHFYDINALLSAKVNGTDKYCFNIGNKEQKYHTFDYFFALKKT